MEKTKDKAKYNDKDPRERYYEREKASAPTWREGEREWMEREKRQEDIRSRNERALLNIEKEVERGMKKGDTFPRMIKGFTDHGRRKMSAAATDEERVERRIRDKPRLPEIDEWEREKEREWRRERKKERERDEIYSRAREESKNTGRRPIDDEKLRRRERYQEADASIQDRRREVGESWAREGRYPDIKRREEILGPNMGEEGRTSSPHRRRDRGIDWDRREREKAQRRDTRSEGDSDERELRMERVRDREREHSRSEGENTGKRVRERYRQGYREDDRQRYRDEDREKDVDRSRRRGVEKDREQYLDIDKRAANERDRERGKSKEREEDRAWSKDRRDDDRYREYKHRKYRERKEGQTDSNWDDTTGRSSRSPNETAPRVPPQTLSSGEWSSNVDNETRYSRARDSYEERERGTMKNERELRDPGRAERSHKNKKRNERHESDTKEMVGSMPGQRGMWSESQGGKSSKEELVYRERHKERRREEEWEPQAQRERDRRGIKEDRDEKQLDYRSYKRIHREKNEDMGDFERETEGVSVDGDDVWEVWRETGDRKKEQLSDSSGGLGESRRREADEENVTEEGERDKEGGSTYLAEGGSDTGWNQEKDRMLPGEEFVTVSSGGDKGEEKEDDEDKELQDCVESREHGVASSPEEIEEERPVWKERVNEEQEGTEKKPKYVFCVIGQTLTQPGGMSPSQADHTEGVERHLESCSDHSTEKPVDDLSLTLSRNDKYLIINHRDQKGLRKRSTAREQRSDSEEADISQDTQTCTDLRSTVDHAELRQIKGDSHTERLLVEWRGVNKEAAKEERNQPSPVPSNPYAEVTSEVNFEQIVDGINTVHMSAEEKEAIQIQLSNTWTMSKDLKRNSQAPHLKWAKNMVRNIMGHSEDEGVDEPNSEVLHDQGIQQTETVTKNDQEEVPQGALEIPIVTVTTVEPELEEEDPQEGLRGMGQRQGDTDMHEDTPTFTHADTLLQSDGEEHYSRDKVTEPFGHLQLEKTDIEVKLSTVEGDEVILSEIESEVIREKETLVSVCTTHSVDREADIFGLPSDVEVKVSQEADDMVMVSEIRNEEIQPKETDMYLSVSNTLYKPNSCPILNSESAAELLFPVRVRTSQGAEDGMGEDEMHLKESEELGTTVEVEKTRETNMITESREGEATAETLRSTDSFCEPDPTVPVQRGGISKPTEGRDEEPVEGKEEEGVGRDRRTRIFSTSGKERRRKMESLLICSNQAS